MDYFQKLLEQKKNQEDQENKEQRQNQQRLATNLPSPTNKKKCLMRNWENLPMAKVKARIASDVVW